MMNETLERRPSDPNYIVKAVASYEFTNIPRDVRRAGDLSDLNIEMRTVIITKAAP
jgi:hypothetical protein